MPLSTLAGFLLAVRAARNHASAPKPIFGMHAVLEALQLGTGCEIYIIDKYPPPDESDDYRLIVIIGTADSVRALTAR